jgi:hypothetical protein
MLKRLDGEAAIARVTSRKVVDESREGAYGIYRRCAVYGTSAVVRKKRFNELYGVSG